MHLTMGRFVLLVAIVAAITLLAPSSGDTQPPPAEMREVAVDWAATPRSRAMPSADDWTVSEQIQAGDAVLVGAAWDGEEPSDVELRVRRGGDWDPWQELEPLDDEDGPDPGTDEAKQAVTNATEPVWVGRVDAIQVRLRGAKRAPEVTLHTVDIGGDDSLAFDPTDPGPGAASAETRPSVVRRSSWDPDNQCVPRQKASYANNVRFAVVHHTAGSNDYSSAQSANIVRSICLYHRNTLGWNDIGYNIVVDRYGRVFEGRAGGLAKAVVGAHASGYNTGSTGISVLGCFHPTGCNGNTTIPWTAVDAVDRTLAWKFRVHGVDPLGTVAVGTTTIPTIVGHRDVGSTACPGDNFYNYVRGSNPMRNRVAGHLRAAPSALSVIRGRQWHYRSRLSRGPADFSFAYGSSTDLKVLGDWNNSGQPTPGVVRDGTWYLTNRNESGSAEIVFRYGQPGDIPVAGDWNGNGRTTAGVLQGRRWHLRNTLSGGSADIVFNYGRPGDSPVVGDWNGDGHMTVGVVRGRTWYLRNSNTPGPADVVFSYGAPDDVPVVGDWNGNGQMTPGVGRDNAWYLRNQLSGGQADNVFRYGLADDEKLPRR